MIMLVQMMMQMIMLMQTTLQAIDGDVYRTKEGKVAKNSCW
jgi:hypothetical protein